MNNQTKNKNKKNMKNKTMLNVTNAKVMTPPFEGWGNHSISPHSVHFTCSEMIFSEPVTDGEVTLNGVTYKVSYDKEAVDHTDGCELPAKLENKIGK